MIFQFLSKKGGIKMECPMCHGKKLCPACNGRGRVSKGPESLETQKCLACDGNKVCPRCGGKGEV